MSQQNYAHRCHTQGLAGDESLEYITFIGGDHWCGNIKNGVGVQVGTIRGVFVVSWEDFEKAYLALKEQRS